MNIITENLFGMRYQNSITDWLFSSFFILVLAALIFYFVYLSILKFSKSGLHRDFHVHTSFLWALSVQQFLLSTYLFFLFRMHSFPAFDTAEPLTYLCTLPHLLLFLGVIILFFRTYKKLKQESQSA